MDKREFLLSFLGRETVSAATKKAAGGVDDLGDSMESTAADAKRLDKEVEDAQKSLAQLAQQYARTSDAADRMDLTRAMRKQQAEIRRTIRAKDLLPEGLGDDAGKGFAARFVARLGPAVASAPISPAMVSAVGPAIPIIAAGVAAAVTGGIAAAGVGAGIALAFQDDRVDAAAADLGREVGQMFRTAAEPFVPATLDAIDTVRGGLRGLEPEFRGLFLRASKYVEPLTEGLVGGAEALVPALRDVVDNAEPVVDVLGKHGTKAAGALGTSLRLLSQDASHTAGALDGILTAVEGVTVGVSALVAGINKVGASMGTAEHAIASFTPLGTVLGSPLILLKELGEVIDDDTRKLKTAGETGQAAGSGVAGGMSAAADATAEATREIQTFADAISEMRDQTLEMERAEVELEAKIDEVAEAAKRAKGGIDTNTAAGRENYSMLLDLVAVTKTSAEAIKARTGSHDLATAATERGRAAFLRAAEAMRVEKGEAERLANQLFGIPNISRTVKVSADQAIQEARRAGQAIAAIKNKTVWISAKFRGIENVDTQMELRLGRRASGGPVVAGRPYLVGEEGPELITPSRDGWVHDASKTERMRTALMSGGASDSSRAGAPAHQVIEHRHTIVLEGTGVMRGIRREIQISGTETTLGIRAEVVR